MKGHQNTDTCNNLHLQSMVPTNSKSFNQYHDDIGNELIKKKGPNRNPYGQINLIKITADFSLQITRLEDNVIEGTQRPLFNSLVCRVPVSLNTHRRVEPFI